MNAAIPWKGTARQAPPAGPASPLHWAKWSRGFSLLMLFVGTCWAPALALALWAVW